MDDVTDAGAMDSEEISWEAPGDFREVEYQRRRGETWLGYFYCGLIGGLLVILFRFLHTNDWDYNLSQSITKLVVYIACVAAFAYLLWMSPAPSRRSKLTRTRFDDTPWRKLDWWRIVDDPGFPGVRVLEAGSSSPAPPRLRRTAFAPLEVDEETVHSFLERVAPDKELKADS